jgi:TonB family protein
MTSSSRKALPWMISLGAHLAAVSVLALVLASPSQPLLAARLDISLSDGTGPGGSLSAARASRSRAVPSAPASTSSPSTASTPESSASDPGSIPRERAAPSSGAAPIPTSLPAPAASDVLADVASVAAGAGGVPGRPLSAQQGGSTGYEWGWPGLPRNLIRKRAPEFPTVLSEIGQEVEVEARIAVAPRGIVTRVEIVKGSGYIEIDASVADALRDYLFSPVDGRVDTIGTVTFRFRLEKQD